MSDALMTPEEVARVLRITPRHVVRLTRAGSLPSVRVGRYHRYEPEDVTAYRAAARSQCAPPAHTEPTLGEALGQVTRRRTA